MTNAKTKLPLFPLGLAILPGEELPLHIFEPRYKELIGDCKAENISFGIPFIEGNSISTFGTNVRLDRVIKYYDNGEIDIVVEGLNIFRIENYYEQLPQKLYAGGDVTFVYQNEYITDQDILYRFNEFHELFHDREADTLSGLQIYDIAGHLNLTSEEKMRLIRMNSTEQRLRFLKNQMKWQSLVKVQEDRIVGSLFPN